ncbi:hypothetical protein DPMN_168030 [Dreissena polymorpha]|uniref:Uncharacterized protein n=1 Tax=Dreissena polymorpha TaxID=45954 RepID=A0A9D4F1U7_DREPO|nr:hypothetical protein DPMN_168030 [Dreissena polymorpha]
MINVSAVVGLDIQDDMGRHEVGFQDNTEKIPMYDDNGCRMETHFLINKVMLIFLVYYLSTGLEVVFTMRPFSPDCQIM